jgi:hypothetical protein
MSKTRKRKAVNFVKDSLINVMSGLGTSSDKGAFSAFAKGANRSYQEFSAMYADTAIARKIVDIIPGDMTREWRTFEDTSMQPEQIKKYEKEETRLQVAKKVRHALAMARLYGGAMLIPILKSEENEDLSQPLDISKIKKGDLLGFTVVEAEFCNASKTITQDPLSINYLMPEFYHLAGTNSSSVHHSRMIRFEGLPLPRREFQINRYWSQSVLENVYNELTNATLVSDSIAALMHELNLDIINIKGLSNALAAGQEAKIQQRFETYTTVKSMFHMAILDEEETFSNRPAPATGISDMIDKFYGLLAAVTDIPATRFLGNAPGGLNATGESDLRNYYDNIKDKQESQMGPQMRILDEIMSRSVFGDEVEDIHEYEWVELWQETKAEKSTRELVDAQRDAIYIQNSVVTEAQVAEELMQNKVYSNIEESHIKELEDAIKFDETEEGDEESAPSGSAATSAIVKKTSRSSEMPKLLGTE